MTPDRRQFLTVSLTAAAVGLAGCSGDKSSAPSINEPAQPVTLPVSEVPSGGGVILKERGFVVTQPEQGEFKAFSSICPHQGCEVTNVAEGEIICGCHGSRFNLSSGDVIKGPATTGLGPAKVTQDGDTLTVTKS